MPRDSSETAAPVLPDLFHEKRAMKHGAKIVAGVDEAGRGPLAGPVVVAAVVLNPRRIPAGLNDSKKLTAAGRDALYDKIMATAAVSVVAAPTSLIEDLNILWATMWAMRRAILTLPVEPDHVLIDGNQLPRGMPCVSEKVIGGDRLSLSIAAASIVAKVTRDRMCEIMHCEEPHFGFDGHKGYSAPGHFAALDSHGPGRFHRMEFAPCLEAAARRRAIA